MQVFVPRSEDGLALCGLAIARALSAILQHAVPPPHPLHLAPEPGTTGQHSTSHTWPPGLRTRAWPSLAATTKPAGDSYTTAIKAGPPQSSRPSGRAALYPGDDVVLTLRPPRIITTTASIRFDA